MRVISLAARSVLAVLFWMLFGAASVKAQEVEGVPPIPAEPLGAQAGLPEEGGNAPTPSESDNAVEQPGGIGRESILSIFRDANPMLWPLALCSVVALGFSLERLVALRKSRVAPRDFIERFIDRLASGKLDHERALEFCRAHDSVSARIIGRAIRYWGQPAAVIRQAVDADASGEIADMKRNIRVLNGTATLAPLLGLLGTVIGLIEAFDALGAASAGVASASPKGEALAHGISLALVATAIGLAIAIFSVVAYFYLLNRVDILIRSVDDQVGRVIDLIASENTWAAPDRRGAIPAAPYDRPRAEGRVL